MTKISCRRKRPGSSSSAFLMRINFEEASGHVVGISEAYERMKMFYGRTHSSFSGLGGGPEIVFVFFSPAVSEILNLEFRGCSYNL